jgi:hypothetical protein
LQPALFVGLSTVTNQPKQAFVKSLGEKLRLLTARMIARRRSRAKQDKTTSAQPKAAREAILTARTARADSTRPSTAISTHDVSPKSDAVAHAGNRIRRPRTPELWRSVDIAPEHDIRLLRPPSLPRGDRFETAEDVAKYDAKRIADLINRRPDLAAEIERREEEVIIPSTTISSRDARDYRVPDIADRFLIAQKYEGQHQIATIYLGAFPAGRLNLADLRRARWSLRNWLDRAGFKGAILTGGTEAAWVQRHGLWILHCHLLAVGVPEKAWDGLRELLPDARPAVALKVQDLVDWPEQLSYCQKFNSTHMPGKRSPTDRAPAMPLPRERLVEWAVWMVRYRFEDFGFHYGCRRRWGHVRPDP